MKFEIKKTFELDEMDCLKMFLESIGMEFLLNELEMDKYFVEFVNDEELYVFKITENEIRCIDERGELFLSLCKVISNLYGNTPHRNVSIGLNKKLLLVCPHCEQRLRIFNSTKEFNEYRKTYMDENGTSELFCYGCEEKFVPTIEDLNIM